MTSLGVYTAEVNGLSQGDFEWDQSLDPTGNDSDLDDDNFPDQKEVMP